MKSKLEELQQENQELKKQIDDLAKFIMEKHSDKIKDGGACETAVEIIEDLDKQLSEIKYLDSIKVYGILEHEIGYKLDSDNKIPVLNYITGKICSLALPSKERIMGIIKKYADKINYPVFDRSGDYCGSSGYGYELDKDDLDKIASEILGDEEW